jgi:uncharacterized protein
VLPLLYGPRSLLALGALALLIVYSTFYLARLVPLPDAKWMTDHVLDARHVYASGGFVEILKFRIHEIPAIAPLHVWVFPRTLALFLLGALVWRTDILQRAANNRWMMLGTALVAAAATLVLDKALATVALALSYAAFVVGVASTAVGAALLGWAAPLGRMAFTNYIVQSLIFGWTFYGYGLGLFGKLDISTTLAFGTAVYVVQVFFSRWWLGRYQFGPLEWLWRALMYGHLPPMGRSVAQ